MNLTDLNISTYTLPAEFTQRLEEAFKGLGLPHNFVLSEGRVPYIMQVSGRESEAVYRALCRYAAREIEALYALPEGRELQEHLLEVMTETKQGVVLRGMPKDTRSKALFILGMQELLGGHEGVDNWFRVDLPQAISRTPIEKYDFHSDGNPSKSLVEKSFMFFSTTEQERLNAGTLFKCAQDPDERHVEYKVAPDEVMLINNKTIKHSSPVDASGKSWKPRGLLRYHIDSTILSHSLQPHGDHVKTLSANVPTDQTELREWLRTKLGNIGRLATRGY